MKDNLVRWRVYVIKNTGMQMQQQYSLRWNNHKINLVTVFGELFRNGDYTDVTLACEDGPVIKCHKMVLAACSSYFQNLFSYITCIHPVILLKDIRHSEIRAILEYMYNGEVNLMREEVAPLLRVAETLRVKGLIRENSYNESQACTKDYRNDRRDSCICQSFHEMPYLYGNTSNADRYDERIPPAPIRSITGPPMTNFPVQNTASAVAMLNSCNDTMVPAGTLGKSCLSRQKMLSTSLLMSKENDSPTLRTAGQIDFAQPVSVICRNGGQNEGLQCNCTTIMPQDLRYGHTLHSASPLPHTCTCCMESKNDGRISSTIANYAFLPSQKAEWKRYKRYTRLDITSAIESVRNGMTALRAAKKFGVPSRTLYDKVKKLGIRPTTTRPSRKWTGNSGTFFAYGENGNTDSLVSEIPMSDISEYDSHNTSSTAEHKFSLERGEIKKENPDHEEMASTPTSLQSNRFLQQDLKVEEKEEEEEAMELELNEQKFTSSTKKITTPNLGDYVQHKNFLSSSSLPLRLQVPNHCQDQVEDLTIFRKRVQQPRFINYFETNE